jgi:hypothetical protein
VSNYTPIHRDIVIKVLVACQVGVHQQGEQVTIATEKVPVETLVLPLYVEKKLLFRFAYKYDIPVHYFFHPEMIAGRGDGTVH